MCVAVLIAMAEPLCEQIAAWQARFTAIALAEFRACWSDAEAATAYLASLVRERLELAESEVCRQRQAFFALEGIAAEAYAERLVALDGAALLVGIRFRDLDPGFPFLEVMADLPLAGLAERLPELKAVLREAFAAFAPRGMTLLLPAQDAAQQPLADALPGAEIWNLYLAGRPVDAPAQPADGPALIRPARLDYADILAEFRRWGELSPELAGLVRPEPEADLQRALDAGLFYELWDQGTRCGLIAAEAKPYWDRRALCLIDELVFAPWQGRGMGKRLQALFHRAVSADFDCVWGTIHPRNQASLRTALACGRRIQAREVFLPF